MRIKELTLRYFRNYIGQDISFHPTVNVLYGQNGQGKTNVLESIFYLLTGKSWRIRTESELITWGERGLYIKGGFEAQKRSLQLESAYQKHKSVRLNGVPCRRLSDYVGLVNAVFFTPDDLDIIKNSPAERRRYLDLFICQNKPSHVSALNNYLKTLRQKSALLRSLSVRPTSLKEQVQIWNEQLAEAGKQIILNREEYVEKLQQHGSEVFSQIFSPAERMQAIYFSLGKKDAKQAAAEFGEMLQEKIDLEIEKRTILIGPHRDDIIFNLNQKAAKYFASQGQQRAMVLSLKLAEMEIVNQAKGEYPILLLDDVLSELDEKRREYLLRYIAQGGRQTLITTTEPDAKILARSTALYHVAAGVITTKNKSGEEL